MEYVFKIGLEMVMRMWTFWRWTIKSYEYILRTPENQIALFLTVANHISFSFYSLRKMYCSNISVVFRTLQPNKTLKLILDLLYLGCYLL